MSSSESENTSSGKSLHTGSEMEKTTTIEGRAGEELCRITPQQAFCHENFGQLSLSAETQRIEREMHRVEMSRDTDFPLMSQGARVSPALKMMSPTRTQMQLLETELTEHKRRVSTLQDSNQRHQKLIQTLQEQLAQYKRKNTDLEMEVEDLKLEVQQNAKKLQSKEMEHDSRLDARENVAKMREESLIAELEKLTEALEEARTKSAELSRANEVLQDQLEEAATANQGLSRDVANLTQAWRQASQQLEKREADWQNEESAFNEYFTTEHNRLLALWREVVSLRRAFAELRHQTSRDFTLMNSEILKMGQSLQTACSTLANNLKAAEMESADAVAKTQRQLMAEEANAKARSQSLAESLVRCQARLAESEDQVIQLNNRIQDLLAEVADKDRVLNTLQRLRESFPFPKQVEVEAETTAEDPIAVTKRLIEHSNAMHQALSQIAQTVIADTANADVDELEEPFILTYRHQIQKAEWTQDEDGDLGAPLSRRPRSTSPSSQPRSSLTPLYFPKSVSFAPPFKLAETAASAVHSALSRRAMQVQALRLKVSNMRGRLEGVNKRFEEGEEERKALMEHVSVLRSDLDLAHKEVDTMRIERDKTKHALSVSTEERNILERTRVTNTEQINSLQTEVEQFRQLLLETSKERDNILEQLSAKQAQHESEVRENVRLQRLLEQSDTRTSKMREDWTTACNKAEEAEKRWSLLNEEYTQIIGKFENSEHRTNELNEQVNLLRHDKQKLQDKLIGLESVIEAKECERSELTHQLTLAKNTEARVVEERNLLRAETQQLRNQLSRVDEELNMRSGELERSREAFVRVEQQRVQTEAETLRVSRERTELAEEVAANNRQISALVEETETLRRDVGLHAATISRLNEEREELMRDKNELNSRLSLNERERRQLSDLVSKLRTDREVLDNEALLSQRQITELKNKVEKQETDIANLTLRRNTLQAEVQRVRSDFETELSKIQRHRDRLSAKYTAEVEELRAALFSAERRLAEAEEAAVQAVLRADRAAAEATKASMRETDRHGLCERESLRWAEEQARLNQELVLAQRERDNALMRAEKERQKVRTLTAEDHAAVRERIVLLQETVADLEKTLERTRCEAASKAEKDEVELKTTLEELRFCRKQLEESKINHEKEVSEWKARIKALELSFERTVHEYNEVQLQLCEESRRFSRPECSGNKKLPVETEENRNILRLEIVDLRKQLNELEAIKCALEVSNQDLRRQIDDLEAEKTQQSVSLSEIRGRLERIELERRSWKAEICTSTVKPGPRDELLVSDLKQKLCESELANAKLQKSCAEMRTNLGEEIANLEEVKRECNALRKRLADEEIVRENLAAELATLKRSHTQTEDRVQTREWRTVLPSDDANQGCKRLGEINQILQSRFEDAEQEKIRLNANLCASQRRLQTIELELEASNESRRDAESRLASIHSSLRRFLGFRQYQGSSPVLMLRSKRRGAGAEASEMASVEAESDHENNQHAHLDRRSRSFSPGKKNKDTGFRSYSVDRQTLAPWQKLIAMNEVFHNDTMPVSTMAGTAAVSSASDPLVRPRNSRILSTSTYLNVDWDLDPYEEDFMLQEVIRQIGQLEKERDDAVKAEQVVARKLSNVTVQLNEKYDEVQQLRQLICSKEEEQQAMSERLRKSHSDLLKHEKEMRQITKERDLAILRSEELQSRLQVIEDECQVIKDRLSASKTQETKIAEDHRRGLRKSLEEAETRLEAAESARRSVEAELNNQRTIASNKASEIQVLKSRLENAENEMSNLQEKLAEAKAQRDRLSQQCEHKAQAESEARSKAHRLAESVTDLEQKNAQLEERLSSAQRRMTTMDHDNHLLRERFENSQANLRDCKGQLEGMEWQIQKLQTDLAEAEIIRRDLEIQNRQLTRLYNEQEIVQKDLNQEVFTIKLEKENMQSKVENLLKDQSDREKKRNELEIEIKELREKLGEVHTDFDHMARERLREKELNAVLVSSQEDVRKRAKKLEEENLDFRRQVQRLSAQLALREESHASRMDEMIRQRQIHLEKELDKKCAALKQCEKTLQAKEASHRQRVRALEEQIRVLNEQLSQEANRRQLYISTSRIPTAPSSTGHYPSMSHLSHTVTQSHETLTNPREFSPSAEDNVKKTRPPRPQLPPVVMTPQTPAIDTALSVSVQTESRTSASASDTQTPSARLP